jgi:diaminopropionate ammonia-lyase
MVGLNCGTPSLIAWPLLAAGLDWSVGIEDERAFRAMRELAGEGVASGETGAAALAGLEALVEWADTAARRRETGLEETTTVLVLCTEGATDPALYRTIVGRDAADVAGSATVGGHGAL